MREVQAMYRQNQRAANRWLPFSPGYSPVGLLGSQEIGVFTSCGKTDWLSLNLVA